MSLGSNGHKNALHFHRPPQRVVSLVPSYTESLFDLGFGETVVGITDYCLHPEGALSGLPRIGGPKNPRVQEIIDLKPDLVIANWEENTRQTVEMLEIAGIPVWVSFPKTVREAVDVLWTLTGVFQSQSAAIRLQTLELTLEWAIAAAAERQPVRYFSPIWFDHSEPGHPWWMTFNQDTYSHDLLSIVGGENVFAKRERRYPLEADLGILPAESPGERDVRYPRLTLEEILTTQPEVILLPDEPYPFGEDEREAVHAFFSDTPAGKYDRIHWVDGSLITWYGSRLARALQNLPTLFELV